MIRGSAGCMGAIMALLFACSQEPAKPQRGGNDGNPTDDPALSLKPQELDMVSVFDLDSSEFLISGVRAGLQSAHLFQGEVPVLTFSWPQKADYVEVLRCTTSTRLSGRFGDSVVDVELGSPSPDEMERLARANDFWETLSQQPSCAAVTSHYIPDQDPALDDPAAPSGSFRYFVRACIQAERLTDAEYGNVHTCSKMVGASNVLSSYQNGIADAVRTRRELARRLEDNARRIATAISTQTIAQNNAIIACEKAEARRVARVERKRIIGIILGAGTSLGVRLLGPEGGIAAVRAGEKTWKELFDDTWNTREEILGDGVAIGTALNWLLSSPEDFPRSCTAAQESESRLQASVKELHAQHELLAQTMDELRAVESGEDGP